MAYVVLKFYDLYPPPEKTDIHSVVGPFDCEADAIAWVWSQPSHVGWIEKLHEIRLIQSPAMADANPPA